MARRVGPPDLRDVNVTTLNGQEVTFAELAATCSTVPFLAEKRLVIVRNLLSRFDRRPAVRSSGGSGPQGTDEWKALDDYLPTLPDTTDLIFADGRLTPRNVLLNRIRKYAEVQNSQLPRGGQLTQWVRDRAQTHGIKIEPRAAQTLADMVGSELRILDSELQKLAAHGQGRVVSHKDVTTLVSNSREASIFIAVDAVIEGRAGPALQHVERLMQAGSPASYILAMLARQVRLLMLAKDFRERSLPRAEIGSRLGLSGFPLRKTLEQEAMVNLERLKSIHQKLVETDLRTKSSGGSDELALDVLITEAASDGEGRSTRH